MSKHKSQEQEQQQQETEEAEWLKRREEEERRDQEECGENKTYVEKKLVNGSEQADVDDCKSNAKATITMTIKYAISKSQYEVLQKVAEMEDMSPEEWSHDAILSSLESDVDNNFGRGPENYHKRLIEKLHWPPKPRGSSIGMETSK